MSSLPSMLATVSSGVLMGIEAWPVTVEVSTGECGEPVPSIVGMASTAVKESKDRVWAAISNSQFTLPIKRTTINLAPGHLRKDGALYDLPIAVAVLEATGQVRPQGLQDYLIAGELSLSGEIRPIRGGLALAACAAAMGKRALLLPERTAAEAALHGTVEVYAVPHLDAACAFLEGREDLEPVQSRLSVVSQAPDLSALDFSDVKGQFAVRRAIEVAAAGGHNLLMIGPPGSGKSMMAKRIPTILPPLSEPEFLDILRIYSASGKTLENGSLKVVRPYRCPHHTISEVGLIGGGTIPGPGEISLAHHGVLFLDELPEFRRGTLEVLRQPLEDGEVTISRSAGCIDLPASFMLVAAMNPCPCGYLGDTRNQCQCTPHRIHNYRSRISGPLLDRIDIHIDAPALDILQLRASTPGESSANLRERIEAARALQAHRYAGAPPSQPRLNARMHPRDLKQHCRLGASTADLLQSAMKQRNLSARAYDRILKVARTIADLDATSEITAPHLLEAIQYRSLDQHPG
jgi:magnesium chelatase family protein